MNTSTSSSSALLGGPASSSPAGGPRKPRPSPASRVLLLAAIATFCWVGAEITLAAWRVGEVLPRFIGQHVGAMTTYQACKALSQLDGKSGALPNLAMSEQAALCFTEDANPTSNSARERVAAALDFDREGAQMMGFTFTATNLFMGITTSHREKLVSQGAQMKPSISSALGLLLTMGSLSAWQADALLQNDKASVSRAQALARKVSRESIIGMKSEADLASGIDQRAPLLGWIAGLAGINPNLFADAAASTEQKALMSYWRFWHPVVPRAQGPDLDAIDAQNKAGAAWLATKPRDDSALAAWLDAMERSASSN